jgi:hypothetical protein
MKTGIIGLALLLLVGLFTSSCSTVDRLNTEYEEETARVEKMSPAEKAEWESQQHEDFMIDMKGYFNDGSSD